MTVHTFSGTHPFRPQCLIDAWVESGDPFEPEDEEWARADAADTVAELIEAMGEHRCFRCGIEFEEKEIPSGSRMTACRCIPVCRVCGEAESFAWDALEKIKEPQDAALCGLIAPVCNWPVSSEETALAVAAFRERYSKITTIPVGDINFAEGPNHGGWLEYGYDESDDNEEREGRSK